MQGVAGKQIELVGPAVLPLGLGWRAGGPQLLAVALQHPPVHLLLYPSEALDLSGARADLAYSYAARWLAAHSLGGRVRVDLELAVPSFMGLGSAASLAVTLGTGLAHWYEQPHEPAATIASACGLPPGEQPLAQIAAQGGLWLCGLPGSQTPDLRRTIQHTNRQAWAFVIVLPRLDPVPEANFELERLNNALQFAPQLAAAQAEAATEALIAALDADDLEGFGAALTQLQGGYAQPPLSAWEQQVCDQLRASGAVACGRSLAGAALFGIVQGDRGSISARQALRPLVPPTKGVVMAAITENEGLRVVQRS
ncbi:hypothetical protein [Candidatus Viridilinea mediisalina]|uniref:GHMP kinase N-terminal domain-containing protein n=1 Tax=Candidatus Viridilinea mediisalina TaxID=2024553 RepID=A0A2A6RJA8_9CHLR|nr:hypothetical protein [Candidatus Viridilinea mediisalina]PDW03157.1 hypothetical protein CJ255_10315 [Candidatus Viridilinea mediisalina]